MIIDKTKLPFLVIPLQAILLFWSIPNIAALEMFLHLQYQRVIFADAIFITFVIVIPLVEELSKYLIMRVHLLKNHKAQIIQIIFLGYIVQLAEAIYLKDISLVRLILPLHFVFSYIAMRYSFGYGFLAHAIWNFQMFFPGHQLIMAIIFYLVFFILLYFDIVKSNYNAVLINVTQSIRQL